jgi:hypothetical protein
MVLEAASAFTPCRAIAMFAGRCKIELDLHKHFRDSIRNLFAASGQKVHPRHNIIGKIGADMFIALLTLARSAEC